MQTTAPQSARYQSGQLKEVVERGSSIACTYRGVEASSLIHGQESVTVDSSDTDDPLRDGKELEYACGTSGERWQPLSMLNSLRAPLQLMLSTPPVSHVPLRWNKI